MRYRRNLEPCRNQEGDAWNETYSTEQCRRPFKAVEAAKTENQYNIFKDLKMLLEAYPKTSKRDYLALIRALMDKYSAGVGAEINDALIKKCMAGDVEAIRLYKDLQKEDQTAGEGVQIIVEAPRK